MPTLDAQRRFREAVEAELGGDAGILWNEETIDGVLCDRFVEAEEAGSRMEQRAAIADQAAIILDTLKRDVPFTARMPVARPHSGEQPPPTAEDQTESAVYSAPLSDAEQHRSWIFRDEMARFANERFGVRIHRFRDAYLSGRSLSVEDATRWLGSPFVAFTPNVRGLPRPGETPARVVSRSTESHNGRVVDRITFDVGGEPFIARRSLRWPARQFKTPDGEIFEFWDRSLVGELVTQATRIARHLPWTDAGAAWFILTGIAPDVFPVHGEFARRTHPHVWQRGVLTIEIEPWVSEKTLLALYRDIRRRVNPRARKLPVHALAARAFVQEQRHASLAPVSLAECCRRWNKAHPEHQYADYRQFTRDVTRGDQHSALVANIVSPGYRGLNPADDL